MRILALLCLALFLCGCARSGLPKDFVQAHELLRKGTIPTLASLYRKTNKVASDPDVGLRTRAAGELKVALAEQIVVLTQLYSRFDLPNAEHPYVPAMLQETRAWRDEARGYLAYLELLERPDPGDLTSLKAALANSTAFRLKACGQAQDTFQRFLGVSSGMSRPQIIDLSR